MELIRHDGVLVLGGGLAGLSAAIAAAPKKALVLTAAPLAQGCSSAWAQGGMAVAVGEDDAPALHAADTVAAGAGLVDPAMARLLAEEGPAAIERLADLGAPFDRDEAGAFAQSLEAAHSRARVARVKGDQAGRAIMDAVIAAALASKHIEIRPNARARAYRIRSPSCSAPTAGRAPPTSGWLSVALAGVRPSRRATRRERPRFDRR